MINEAVRVALKDALMTIGEIDMIVLENKEFFEVAHMMDCWLVHAMGGIYGRQGLKIITGDTVGATLVCAGDHLVDSGLFDKVLCNGFEKKEEVTREPS